MKAVRGVPRWTESLAFSASAVADYPAANLGIMPLARVWRSPDLESANTVIIATSATALRVGLVAMIRHNLSLDATFRLRLYADEAMTDLLYDSGVVEVWPVVYGPDELEWEDDNWWLGKFSARELAGTSWTRPIWLGAYYVTRAIKLELFDQTNGAGFVEVGLLDVSGGWEAQVNFGHGTEYGFRWRTKSHEAIGGAKYFDRRAAPRVVRGVHELMSRDEVLMRGLELLRQHDQDVPFLWVPHPDEPKHWLRNAFLCRNVGAGLMSYAAAGLDNYPFAHEEVL